MYPHLQMLLLQAATRVYIHLYRHRAAQGTPSCSIINWILTPPCEINLTRCTLSMSLHICWSRPTTSPVPWWREETQLQGDTISHTNMWHTCDTSSNKNMARQCFMCVAYITMSLCRCTDELHVREVQRVSKKWQQMNIAKLLCFMAVHEHVQGVSLKTCCALTCAMSPHS